MGGCHARGSAPRTPFDHVWFDGLLGASGQRPGTETATIAPVAVSNRATATGTRRHSWGEVSDDAQIYPLPTFPAHVRPQPTRLLGRRSELDLIRQVLLTDDVRLVTLTGPGGVGKTRLAIEVAGEVGREFAQSACFIDLSLIRDPDLLPSALAHGIGLQDTESRLLLERLQAYLQDRNILLILDNFERVLPSAPYLVALLERALRSSSWSPVGSRSICSGSTRSRSGHWRFRIPSICRPFRSSAKILRSRFTCSAVRHYVRTFH